MNTDFKSYLAEHRDPTAAAEAAYNLLVVQMKENGELKRMLMNLSAENTQLQFELVALQNEHSEGKAA